MADDYELQELINNLIGLTLQICELYEEIIKYLLKNNQEDLKLCIERLKELKKQENSFYEDLEDNIGLSMQVLDFFKKKELTSNEMIDKLTYERIVETLERINYQYLAQNPELCNGKISSSVKDILIAYGYDDEDATAIAIRVSFLLRKSLLSAVNNIRMQTIINNNNDFIKKLYLNKNIYSAVMFGGIFEQELIEVNFSFLPNKLSQELSEILNIKGKDKQRIINILLESHMRRIISKIMTCSDALEFDEYYIEFKSYILHLDDEELNRYKDIISIESIYHNYEPRMLLNEIDAILTKRKNKKRK